jgi:hypothetical protein
MHAFIFVITFSMLNTHNRMIKREKLLKLWDNIRKMGKILVLSGNTIILFYKGRGVKEIEVEKRKNEKL